jgi:3-dehydroquinate synthase
MRTVQVSLGPRSYPILIGAAALAKLGSQCASIGLGARCAVITDTHVGRLFACSTLDKLRRSGFDPILVTVPAGEKSKSLDTVSRCYQRLAAHRVERTGFVIALGGGVVGDLAGFVAATYLRGIGFVQVATTLLAQVDSSVGGKVGVNLDAGKNLVGAFHQPRLVVCDLKTLMTLPDREFRAGLAEVIKYGIIFDSVLFDWIESNMEALLRRARKKLAEVVARCCEIKADVVSRDETEAGLRAILNFGHTIGHAIEAVFHYGDYLHGEAISIGQVAATVLSNQLAGLPGGDVERVRRLFERAGLPTQIVLVDTQWKQLKNAMRLDKKTSGGDVKFVLAERIGAATWGHPVRMELVRDALQAMSGSRSAAGSKP